jgi:hypothetical protein
MGMQRRVFPHGLDPNQPNANSKSRRSTLQVSYRRHASMTGTEQGRCLAVLLKPWVGHHANCDPQAAKTRVVILFAIPKPQPRAI